MIKTSNHNNEIKIENESNLNSKTKKNLSKRVDFVDEEKADLKNESNFDDDINSIENKNSKKKDFKSIEDYKLSQWNEEGKWIPYENLEYESAFFSFFPNCFFKIRNITSRPFTFHPFKCLQVSLGEIMFTFMIVAIVASVTTFLALDDIKNFEESTGTFASILLSLSFASSGKNLLFHLFMGMPWERQVTFHKFLAYMAITVSATHGFIMGLGHDESLSGVILAASIGAIIVFSFFLLRRYCYSLFYILHLIIVVVIIVFAVLHETFLVFFGIGAWGFDVFIRIFLILRFQFKTEKTELFILPGELIRVEITFKQKKRFKFRGGQYVFICIPKANIWEFHPISISNSSFDRKVVLHFKKVGRWTQKVYALVEKKGVKNDQAFYEKDKKELYKKIDNISSWKKLKTKVFVNGPYGNPRVNIDSPRYKLIVIIAGGIGITPMQSIYNELLIQHIRGRPFIKVKLIWSLRDIGMLNSIANHVDSLYDKKDILPSQISMFKKCNLVNLQFTKVMEPNFYLTKNVTLEDKNELENKYNANIHLGRPNFPKIMDEICALAIENNLHDVAVLSCGPKGMISHAFKTSYEKTKKYPTSNGKTFKVNFDFHSEEFEF